MTKPQIPINVQSPNPKNQNYEEIQESGAAVYLRWIRLRSPQVCPGVTRYAHQPPAAPLRKIDAHTSHLSGYPGGRPIG
jgi:hypothetical protein